MEQLRHELQNILNRNTFHLKDSPYKLIIPQSNREILLYPTAHELVIDDLLKWLGEKALIKILVENHGI
jgi:hypothetical protein